MSARIEDYALMGDTRTAALVSAQGSIDWLCLPRFDSPACFAALLGTGEHGRWSIAPAGEITHRRRRYRPDTMILETELRTPQGSARLTECMSPADATMRLARVVSGVSGQVRMCMELVIRFGYGSQIPWVRRVADTLVATAGPHSLELRCPVELKGAGFTTTADFTVSAGQEVPFLLSYFPSHEARPAATPASDVVAETERWWRTWCSACGYRGHWREAVIRSLMVLKTLTYAPTGAILAAPTTSLPEQLGGVRNWDYRFCWLRDATFALYALLVAGYGDEARAWREWLLRAAAGRPEDLQILYGVTGERDIFERELRRLPGYAGSRPVRIGNAASTQFQLDVYGEVIDTMHAARTAGLPSDGPAWRFQRVLLDFLESHWQQPDNGIWESRGARQQFTHSKVMTWVAFDRAVKAVEQHGLQGSVSRWRELRDRIHREVCRHAFDRQRNTFVQSYSSRHLDASLLIIPLVGFLAPDDPRVLGTLEALERELLWEGLLLRYRGEHARDGLPPGEGAFLPCSFWLADNLALTGQQEKAEALFERLLSLRNDVGLLSEEYDPVARRMLGNFPQALTHLSIVDTAFNLYHPVGPAGHRSGTGRSHRDRAWAQH